MTTPEDFDVDTVFPTTSPVGRRPSARTFTVPWRQVWVVGLCAVTGAAVWLALPATLPDLDPRARAGAAVIAALTSLVVMVRAGLVTAAAVSVLIVSAAATTGALVHGAPVVLAVLAVVIVVARQVLSRRGGDR